ncbi:O-antigen ligase family protein [Candidatus Roizmanbacteria bacterium]|nr:O-antigen ligase family protein [Candidatus Roizmanbacteria bacterium]
MIDSLIRILFYALFLVTPLLMSSLTSELFEFNKMMFIYLIALLITSLWLCKMILAKKIMSEARNFRSAQIIIKKTPFDVPILLFVLSQIMSTLFSIDKHTSFFGYYGRFNGGFLSIFAYVVLFYAFVSNFSLPDVKKLLKISLLSSLMVILWGLPGRFGLDLSCFIFVGQLNNQCWTDQFRPSERMFSTLGQPNWLGAYLAINFFIGLYFLIKSKRLFSYSAYLFLNFVAIIFTRSRSSLMAVLAALTIFVAMIVWQRSKAIIIIIFLISFVGLLATIKQFNRSSINSSSVTTSYDIRKIVWQGAVDLGLRNPLLGTGVETFAYGYYFVRPKEHNLTSEWDFIYNKAHNEFLNYFATTGFLGLAGYLFFIFSFIIFSLRSIKQQKDKLLLVFLLLAYLTILVTNFFGFSTTTIQLFFYLIPGFVLLATKPAMNEVQYKFNDLEKSQWAALFLLVLLFILSLFSLTKYYLADMQYAAGDRLLKAGQYSEAADAFLKANKLKYEPVYEDKLSYALANLAFLSSYQGKQEKTDTQKLISLSDSYNLKTLKASPKNVLYWKTRAKNYFLFYQITSDNNDLLKGIEALRKAQELAPTDPKVPYSLALYYSLLLDSTNELSEADDSINPNDAEVKKELSP